MEASVPLLSPMHALGRGSGEITAADSWHSLWIAVGIVSTSVTTETSTKKLHNNQRCEDQTCQSMLHRPSPICKSLVGSHMLLLGSRVGFSGFLHIAHLLQLQICSPLLTSSQLFTHTPHQSLQAISLTRHRNRRLTITLGRRPSLT